jgi:valyl-tRNA synthetase
MQPDKVYEPQRFEPHWAQWWIETNLYRAQIQPGRPVFSIVIPPPNVTGSLHIGHMFEHTIADVAVRWHRMRGDNTLWLPGMDHAGIATQMVVERQLAAQGLNRKQLGREEFERRVWHWKEQYGGRIKHQIEREGASVDWSRERFTMDEGLSRAVREVFVRLWEAGLIYRGEYMVNWCPSCQTAISDVETKHDAEPGFLWYVRYPLVGSNLAGSNESVVVATTRPETILGDTAVAVNPDDARYQHLIGQRVRLPIVGREIPIIADSVVDPKFGTGVVKVTPAHDPTDFEIGKRHGLPFVKVIGEDARMTAAAGAHYAGVDRFEARKRVVVALEQSGELVKIEPYTVNLSKCVRSNTIIEPLVSMQWFVRMKPLAEKAIEAVESGAIRFVPDDHESVFFQWMRNIRDWCISRQLWWGHRIPAWHCRHCGAITVARVTPTVCGQCQSTEIEQDTDVLDTWFSSGLWPFSTLGWPDDTADLRAFYPTSLMITGFDILFFWVARMIMLGIWCTGKVPFREVHLHGLVRDAERQKISKSKGNTVDPLDLMDRFGTDACRVGLLLSAAPGADIALKEDRLAAARAFANKLWNASRLLFLHLERSEVVQWSPAPISQIEALRIEDQWMLARLDAAVQSVSAALHQHRYHEATQTLWDLAWHDFCDWYLEIKKLRFTAQSGLTTDWVVTLTVYETLLRLLHPFMPFVTEELWQRFVSAIKATGQPVSISLAAFPLPSGAAACDTAPFVLLQRLVTAARELRADNKLDPKSAFDADLYMHGVELPADTTALLESLTKLRVRAHVAGSPAPGGLVRANAAFDLRIDALPPSGQNGAGSAGTRTRILKDIAALEKVIDSSRRQLSDEVFMRKAPAKVIETLRAKLSAYETQLGKLKDQLEGLS